MMLTRLLPLASHNAKMLTARYRLIICFFLATSRHVLSGATLLFICIPYRDMLFIMIYYNARILRGSAMP